MTPRQIMELEQFLARRLKDHGGRHVDDGVSDPKTRKRLFREIIVREGLGEAVIGTRNGKPERYGEFFKRLYGESLE